MRLTKHEGLYSTFCTPAMMSVASGLLHAAVACQACSSAPFVQIALMTSAQQHSHTALQYVLICICCCTILTSQ
jgi:hypothetical protein